MEKNHLNFFFDSTIISDLILTSSFNAGSSFGSCGTGSPPKALPVWLDQLNQHDFWYSLLISVSVSVYVICTHFRRI